MNRIVAQLRNLLSSLLVTTGLTSIYRPTTSRAMSKITGILDELQAVADYQVARATAASDRAEWWDNFGKARVAEAEAEWKESIEEADLATAQRNKIAELFTVVRPEPAPNTDTTQGA